MTTAAVLATRVAERWAERATERDPSRTFAKLGYEPNCRPRHDAAERGMELVPCGLCPQEQYHSATEFDVLYGGAAGGGKSKALLMSGLADAMTWPGIRIIAFRRTYDELEESLLKELEEVDFARALGGWWNGTKHELRFSNRSIIRFRHAETVPHASRRQGGEYQRLIVDERTLVDPSVIAYLEERLRSGRADLPVLGIRSSCNPGGPGHMAVKARYIDATNHGQQVVLDPQGRSVRFIPAKVVDNPHVLRDDVYMGVLNSIPDPARRAAMKDGNWDVFVGQYFEQWNFERHTIDPFPVPKEWSRYEGIDYGRANPWCVLWGAVDGDGRLWVHREIYETGIDESVQARRIKQVDEEEEVRPTPRAADPSMWSKVGEANSIAQTYEQEGCHLNRANNNRVSGWARVSHYLGEMDVCPHHAALGWDTCPRLHVFRHACPNLIRTLPTLSRSKTNPEDVDTATEDHAADTLRYLCMEIPLAPTPLYGRRTARTRIPTGIGASRTRRGSLTNVHGYTGGRR